MTQQSRNFSRAPVLQGARVLIVEDDVLLLMELESILVDAGAEIAGSCRTVQAGLAAANDSVAAAVLDVRVGPDSIAPVARQLASQGTPFVFYTGQVRSDPELAEWPGCTVLTKPARAGTIVSAVADLLRRTHRDRV